MGKESRWVRVGMEFLDADESCKVQFVFRNGHGPDEVVILTFRDKAEAQREGSSRALEALAHRLGGRVDGNIVTAPRREFVL